jgi:hypothetical protein
MHNSFCDGLMVFNGRDCLQHMDNFADLTRMRLNASAERESARVSYVSVHFGVCSMCRKISFVPSICYFEC